MTRLDKGDGKDGVPGNYIINRVDRKIVQRSRGKIKIPKREGKSGRDKESPPAPGPRRPGWYDKESHPDRELSIVVYIVYHTGCALEGEGEVHSTDPLDYGQ